MRILLIASLCLGAIASPRADTLYIAHQSDYFPYCRYDSVSGESSGLVIDWWRLWATKADTPVAFIPGTVPECIERVKNGQAHIISGLFAEAQKMDTLLFGDPLVRLTTSLYLLKHIRPKTIYEVQDSIALLTLGASYGHIRQHYPELNLREYSTAEAMGRGIETKEIPAFFYERPTPLVEVQFKNFPKGYYNYLDIHEDAMRPAVAHGNTTLLGVLQLAADKMTEEDLRILAAEYDIVPKRDNSPWIVAGAAILMLLFVVAGTIYTKHRANRPSRVQRSSSEWQVIIGKGESDRIEFKSSLRWDLREKKANKALEYVIVKTISAFLNSEGGMLFIGVDDDGNILGLENDYKVMSKPNADGFLLIMTNLINKHFGKNAHRIVHATIVSINQKDVCIVEAASSQEPIFLKKGEREEFYIRASAASVPLGLQESAKYIGRRWGK